MFCQPNSIRLYLVNKGVKKYPIDADAVTIPVAKVLFLSEKCFPTSDTGTLIAVAPNAVPTNKPKLNFLSISPYLLSLKEGTINYLNTEVEPKT